MLYALKTLYESINNLKSRLIAVELQSPSPSEIRIKFEKVDQSLKDNDQRFAVHESKIETRVETIHETMKYHAEEIKAIGRSLHNINNSLTRIEYKLNDDSCGS